MPTAVPVSSSRIRLISIMLFACAAFGAEPTHAAITHRIAAFLEQAAGPLAESAAPQAPTDNDESSLPTGADVLDRFVEATGGREAYASVQNRVLTGTLEFVGMGIQSKVQSWQVAPNKFYTLRNTEGLGPVEEGCDGEVVWSSSLTQGPEVARGALRAFKLRSFRFNADCHWRELYDHVVCTGTETVAQIECYKVIKYPVEGYPETAYYALKSGLLVGTELTVPTPMGDIPTQSFYSNYRRVGDLLVPFREVIRTMGREQRMDYDAIVYDGEIPQGCFDLPQDIRALVERYRAQAEADGREGL